MAPPERRERSRQSAEHATALGTANLNPFGDLHTVQHLSARLAKSLRGVFEPLVNKKLRTWAEPLVVQRSADYRAEREPGLTAWLDLPMTPGRGSACAVIDGGFMLEMLDCFFGGDGEAPSPMPAEFTPSAEVLANRIGKALAADLGRAWEPLERIEFRTAPRPNMAIPPEMDGNDPVIVTRFGIAAEHGKPVFVDILYPVAALKPYTPSLTARVHTNAPEPEPQWRNSLTRATMAVRLPVRSVLAEPIVSLAMLMDLKPGDVIPISFGPEVPIMVASQRFGSGTVGTANGQAAIRITSLKPFHEEDYR
jgi:flagellar motor switch protein FliM